MQITSPAFAEMEKIPPEFTCDENRLHSPLLAFADVPEGAQSLVLIMDDPDVPKALRPDGLFVHWVLFNIPPETAGIPEDGTAGTPGANGRDEKTYTGPCPPPEYEPTTHRYFFKLYALDTMLDLPEGANKDAVETAMNGHIIESATLIGTYSRAN